MTPGESDSDLAYVALTVHDHIKRVDDLNGMMSAENSKETRPVRDA